MSIRLDDHGMNREPIRHSAALALLCLALALSCSGCIGKPAVVATPIPVPPAKITLPPRPLYATSVAPPNATYQQQLTWMTTDFTACRAMEEQYRTLLGPYAANPDEPTNEPPSR